MPLSVPEERRLAEIERELAEDNTLVTLAAEFAAGAAHRKPGPVPAPRVGWTLAALLSAIGLVVLIGGLTSSSPAGIAVGGVLAALFQAPLLVLTMVSRRRRRPAG